MKTKWNAFSVKRTSEGMMEKYKCGACPSYCIIIIPIVEEPPENCTKGVKDGKA